VELLRQALEALENGKRVRAGEGGTKYQPPLEDSAIAALRAALKQPEPMCVGCEGKPTLQNSPCAVCGKIAQQEQGPVAWIEHGLVEAPDGLVWEKRSVGYYTPLYTHPPRREPEPPPEPISDAKIRAEFRDLDRHTLPGDMTLEDWFEAGVRFAERQHEIV
jgi:hypothetical protein